MPTRKLKATLGVLALIAISETVRAADQTTVAERTTTITDPVKIAKILSAVPAIDGTLADRLTVARLRVTALSITRLTSEDVADEPARLHLKAGDTAIRIFGSGFANGVAKVSGCNLWESPSFVKHGSTYYPDDKTSNWLLTGQCIAP
ncbi:TPA: hypothetical protein QDA94_004185 [Burkholderia vietnamiensis]|uniref:hypothetical protein n=1 Tax=Burkholderia cepacia complex TaxID=87882 RepID=UPI001592EBDA|nr:MULTISPECIES: hypothetical protein [Burkholderia cepacia complex]MBU9658327.1 hypothetical protein [Burkholderia cenocepacia]HDR8918776.1 hypothetical protein [Burkholderia vietnamiensis]HDR8976967.1 hypothetical protein [Burkholderia vietnamiensis]HDR9049927.1 hypothetical protein [Burkholderia vietnamiensis]HDR9191197.1 hypothetical protein [Burkholderia vietnamiensis]